MNKPRRLGILFLFYLMPGLVFAQSITSGNSGGSGFNGTYGITLGGSLIGADQFSFWASQNNRAMSTTNFLNFGAQGFAVKNHFVYGAEYRHDGLLASSSLMSPSRTGINMLVGISPFDSYRKQQIVITVGIGYAGTKVNFHHNPPTYLQGSSYGVPANLAKLKQNNLWINPKILILHITKAKIGIELGASYYVSGNYKYGYDYTYYSYGYYNGHYQRQSHTQFIGYTVFNIPKLSSLSFNLSAYIGF